MLLGAILLLCVFTLCCEWQHDKVPSVHSELSRTCLAFIFWLSQAEKCSSLGKALHLTLSLFTQQSDHSGGGAGQIAYHKDKPSHLTCTRAAQQQQRSNLLTYCKLYINICSLTHKIS